MKSKKITLCVNGRNHLLEVPVHRTLLNVLRDDLRLTETKYGCGTGECGGCTVLVDGRISICSCLTLAVEMDGRNIITVGGMTHEGELHPIQKAFIEAGAIQCGYCTPGMIMKTASILADNPLPSEEEIRRGLEGNICRCTGYEKIVQAVQRASRMMDTTHIQNARSGCK
jgi:aerobic-type carbon monoxide dehydrogenase small subunit (CoxS/CutS family)